MYAAFCGPYNDREPRQKHYYGLHHLHYITRNTYRRARVFDRERFKRQWIRTLDELRSELNFKIYVLMPGAGRCSSVELVAGTSAAA